MHTLKERKTSYTHKYSEKNSIYSFHWGIKYFSIILKKNEATETKPQLSLAFLWEGGKYITPAPSSHLILPKEWETETEKHV